MSDSLNWAKPTRHLFSLKGLTLCLIATIAVSVGAALAGLFHVESEHGRFVNVRQETKYIRILQQAMSDSHIAAVEVAFGARRVDLKAYYDGLETIQTVRPWVEKFDSYFVQSNRPEMAVINAQLDELTALWGEVISLAQLGKANDAQNVINDRNLGGTYAKTRDILQLFWRERMEVAVASQSGSEQVHYLAVLLQVVAGLWSIGGMMLVYRMSRAEFTARADAKLAADASRTQMAQLFQMADMLQSASGQLDANAVLKSTSEKLLPNMAGALYVFNNSRDRLDRSTTFGPPSEFWDAPESISPTQCWALKRGKPHVNDMQAGSLCCDHHASAAHPVLEIPMTARGELLGLLQISTGDKAQSQLQECSGLAMAIADGMSLALSNIALREKLRGQALRDPLTGLYNRRYMEDSLDRLSRLAKREKKNLSLLMIDLDHFKKLNDTHGHAMGDSVLREVAAAILGCLRESDVGCRYGGEELLVILPDCSMEDAAEKAESIRARIQDLSGQHGASISASLGISSMPETAMQMTDLISSADAALYAAKRNGRNCVVRAEPPRTKTPKALVIAAE